MGQAKAKAKAKARVAQNSKDVGRKVGGEYQKKTPRLTSPSGKDNAQNSQDIGRKVGEEYQKKTPRPKSPSGKDTRTCTHSVVTMSHKCGVNLQDDLAVERTQEDSTPLYGDSLEMASGALGETSTDLESFELQQLSALGNISENTPLAHEKVKKVAPRSSSPAAPDLTRGAATSAMQEVPAATSSAATPQDLKEGAPEEPILGEDEPSKKTGSASLSGALSLLRATVNLCTSLLLPRLTVDTAITRGRVHHRHFCGFGAHHQLHATYMEMACLHMAAVWMTRLKQWLEHIREFTQSL